RCVESGVDIAHLRGRAHRHRGRRGERVHSRFESRTAGRGSRAVMDRAALEAAYAAALRYLEGLPERPVGARADATSMRAALGGPLPEEGEPAASVVEKLAREADPGIVASGGPRFFGFVIGGSVPASLGADWLTSA